MRRFQIYILLFLFYSCQSSENVQRDFKFFSGPTQGTTYNINCVGDSIADLKPQIDSILLTIDNSLSSWVENSTINRFNDSIEIIIDDKYFMEMFFASREISEKSGSAFHPMVMPLVKAWGFGPEGGQIKDNVNIDSLRELVSWNFEFYEIENASSTKAYKFIKKPGMQIDFNAIAQGYSVDIIADFIENNGINDYMVEIGGELRAKGKNAKGHTWRIAIDRPLENTEERILQDILLVDDASLATSGSYRKFYEKEGQKYSHTIDPLTGKPVTHSLLSVTVMAEKAATADAYATAFMVMGKDKTITFIEENPQLDLEVYLIYSNKNNKTETYISKGMKEYITN